MASAWPGPALLRHSFGQLYARGFARVALSADSDNLTGAIRLYERAGMPVVRSVAACEKVLRTDE